MPVPRPPRLPQAPRLHSPIPPLHPLDMIEMTQRRARRRRPSQPAQGAARAAPAIRKRSGAAPTAKSSTPPNGRASRPTPSSPGYLPANAPEGSGLVACKTIPGNRVENCHRARRIAARHASGPGGAAGGLAVPGAAAAQERAADGRRMGADPDRSITAAAAAKPIDAAGHRPQAKRRGARIGVRAPLPLKRDVTRAELSGGGRRP